jgi:hypothetical protein
MKDFFSANAKSFDVAFLLLMVLVMDVLKIQDDQLRYVLLGIAASLTGFRGLLSAVAGGKTQPAPPAQ